MSFPDNIFDTVNEQRAHKATYITAASTAGPPMMHILNPVADGTPDTDLITTRAIVPVPHRYVHLAMSRFPQQLRAAWHTVADAILHDNNEVSCAPLLEWLRVAATKQFDTDGTTIFAPDTHPGLLDTALPPFVDDQHLANRRWSVIARELHSLEPTTSPTPLALASNQYAHILGVLRSERAADRAADDARRQPENLDKLPSETK